MNFSTAIFIPEGYFIMKKIIPIICSICILLLSLCGCSPETDSGKLKIVTTMFPAYDFARNIAGDNADVSLLLPAGVESHSFEPTPRDMVKIENCDIFIFNGGESESWVEGLLDSCEGDFSIVRMIDSAEENLLEEDEGENGHDHDENHNHGEGEIEYDEHIWTSPAICTKICSDITTAICTADSDNSKIYEANLDVYTDKLKQLDSDFKNVVSSAERKEFIFGDRFPFKYFADEYGLTYYAAFPGCSSQTEPSAATIAKLISKTNEDNIPAIFYIEMSNRLVADTLAESTGAKELLFHSCHNLTKDEMQRGEDYLSLMNKNLENLKIALN